LLRQPKQTAASATWSFHKHNPRPSAGRIMYLSSLTVEIKK
jgi:hypothetical protein